MQTQTVLFIILAAIVALLVVLFQYYYKPNTKGKTRIGLSFLRFIAVFGILVILINPKFVKNEYQVEKPNLAILIDNSSSVKKEAETLKIALEKLKTDINLKDRFKISSYSFGEQINIKDSFSFSEKSTNITNALKAVKDIYARTNTAVVLLTDGNQTIGEDYEYVSLKNDFSVFPVSVGDTTTYEDIRIESINSNPYSFLKNKFPVEFLVNYTGEKKVSKTVTIKVNGVKEYQEKVSFSETNNSKSVRTTIKAKSIGVKTIEVSVGALENEKNRYNNTKKSHIEVIDETTKIAIISSVLHPDIGTLKKSIETNQQREVLLLSPTATRQSLEKIDLFILYQPNISFSSVYNYIKQRRANSFVIGGTKTDWNFLNKVQQDISIQNGYPIQSVSPKLNPAFTKFDISEFHLDTYPPLETNAGPIKMNGDLESVINMQVKGIDINNPLLLLSTKENHKNALWFGENIWKWRMQEYRESKEFKNFDNFISKVIIYLTSSKTKNRLNVDYEKVYPGSTNAKITATYFDESFAFDTSANLQVNIKNKSTGEKKVIPMLLKSTYHEADISNLSPEEYVFRVSVLDKNYSKSGSFAIGKFEMEEQFVSSNYKKLEVLANNHKGYLFYPNQLAELKNNLLDNKAFLPLQKKSENIVPLVDFRILLAIIILALAIEWFLRKYKGLI